MAVYVESARIDENGKAYGGAMANCVWSPDVLPDAWEEVSDTVE